MREEIKIAIFGLSLNVLDTIKQKVRLMYDDSLDVSWANIADFYLVFINEYYSNTV